MDSVISSYVVNCTGTRWHIVGRFSTNIPLRLSWCTDEVERIMNLEDVDRSVALQCQYGAQHEGHPIKKPTGFMSNSIERRKALSKTCKGKQGHCSRADGGDHILCNGRVARLAAIFPVKLC